jgi:penicillin-binding protein 1A
MNKSMKFQTDKRRTDVIKKRAKHPQRSLLGRLIKWGFILFLLLVVVAAGAAVAGYHYFSADLPRIESLADYHPPIVTTVYADDGQQIAEFYTERRVVVPLEQIPPTLIAAFVASEDARFYKHKGIDLFSIVRAFFKNLEAGEIVQGGSTITQQVTKSFLLTPERSYRRKIKEAILAYKIEKTFSKQEILYLYLNQIYMGHGAYGVAAAAQNYFGKEVAELSLAECAMLAGLPQAPSRYSPFRAPDKARQRQIYVLNRMQAEGYINNLQASAAMAEALDIYPRRNLFIKHTPYYTEYVRQYVQEHYGEEMLYKEGLQIHTAVNVWMQAIARQAIEDGLRALDKRQGYRGPLRHLAPERIDDFSQSLAAEITTQGGLLEDQLVKGVVADIDDKAGRTTVRIGQRDGIIDLETMRWARKPDPEVWYKSDQANISRPSEALAVGDVIEVRTVERQLDGTWLLLLEQAPAVEGALLSIEAGTGFIKAMIGGRDFRQSQFNRAVQARRQPGSAFKPIIYTAAIDKGFTPTTMVVDSPIVYRDAQMDFTWKPKNYAGSFQGKTLLRQALAKSMNVVTVKILSDIGVNYTIDYARKLGITSPLSRDLSIALGSSGLSMLELVNAFAVFNNQGDLVAPIFITRIVDRDGNILEVTEPSRQPAIEPSTAYIMTRLLQGVVQDGTGWRVKALERPAAGKTGTSNDQIDAWFLGYTPQFTTGVWVGYDEEASLGRGESGGSAASPIWLDFMQQVLADYPTIDFPVPKGVEFATVDAQTGLLAIPESEQTIYECFKAGTAPTQYTKKPGTVTEQDEFFKKLM